MTDDDDPAKRRIGCGAIITAIIFLLLLSSAYNRINGGSPTHRAALTMVATRATQTAEAR